MVILMLEKQWDVIKIFTELRYPPSTIFFDKKDSVLKNLLVKFPKYKLKDFDKLSMRTEEFPGVDFTLLCI